MMNLRTSTPAPIMPGDAPRRSRTGLVLVLVVAVLVGALALALVLTRDGDGAVSTETTPQVTTPATTAAAPAPTAAPDPQAATKAAVIEAYRLAMDEFVAVGKDLNAKATDPRLAQHRTGTALLAVQQSLATDKSRGYVYRGTLTVHPTITDLRATTATLVDCNQDRLEVVEASTGRVITPAGTQGYAATVEMIHEGGVWKVNHFKDEKRTCVPPAAS